MNPDTFKDMCEYADKIKKIKNSENIGDGTMKITNELKGKLVKRVFGKDTDILGVKLKESLIDGDYIVNITKKEKYTIAEVIIDFDNYSHHYFGLSAKHPLDKNSNLGEINAIKDALHKMMLHAYCKYLMEQISKNKRLKC